LYASPNNIIMVMIKSSKSRWWGI